MKTGRWCLMGLVVLASIACARLAWTTFSDHRDRDYWEIGIDSRIFDRETRRQNLRRAFPGGEGVVLAGTAEEYIQLAPKHPERPWYLWQWWMLRRSPLESPAFGLPFRGVNVRPEELSRAADIFEADAKYMAARDPESGYSLILLAAIEAAKGVTMSPNEDGLQAEVVDPEAAGRAVELLHRAAAKEHITLYGGELTAERLGLLVKPETYADGLLLHRQLSRTPVGSLPLIRCLSQRIMAEAERRATMSPEQLASLSPPLSVADIAADVQTFGAKYLLDAANYIDVPLGLTAVGIGTMEGTRLLKAVGRGEEADRILARGRALMRPWLLATLMEDLELPPKSRPLDGLILENDPELIGEAKRLLALRRENASRTRFPDYRRGDHSRASYLTMMSIPLMHLPWTTPPISFDDLRIASMHETWARQKLFLAAIAAAACLTLLLGLFLYGLHVRTFRNETAEWPSLRRAAVAAALCGLAAGAPGLLVSFAGNFLWALIEDYATWQFFWNCWAVLLASWIASLLVRRWYGDAFIRDPGETEGQSEPRRKSSAADWRRWLAPGGLVSAIPFAYLGYVVGTENNRFVGNLAGRVLESGYWEWTAAFLFLALVGLGGLYALLRRIAIMLKQRSWDGTATPALRLLLLGWAGGILLWTASYRVVDREERKWVARDTLLFPRASGAKTEFRNPIDRRLAECHIEQVQQVLAEEREASQ